MSRKQVNIILIILALAIIFVIGKDFIVNKAGKNIPNPFNYDMDQFRIVDSTTILYKETITFPVLAFTPKGIAVSGKIIYVVTEKDLLKFDYTGKQLLDTVLPDTANCITTTKDGNIWIGFLHSAGEFDANGKLLTKWNSFGDRSLITSLAVNGGNVYVADAGNRIVYHCNTQGKILLRIGEMSYEKGVPGYIIPSPYFDVALDDNGFLWAANTGQHSLENYNKDGSLRTSWGKSSTQIDGFCGCCNPAQFAILPDNSFITSEKGIPRIKLYDQHGVMLGIVASPKMFENGWYAPDVTVDEDERVVALDFDRLQVRIFERKKDGNK
jgi:hypothetical protein